MPDAILTADLHIRADKPRARIDNFQEAMWRKFEFILALSDRNGACPILAAGDLGDESEWPNWLLREFIYPIATGHPKEIFVIPGQHDLPNHNIKLWPKSALGVLSAKETIYLLLEDPMPVNCTTDAVVAHPFPYGVPITRPEKTGAIYNIAMSHQFVLEGKGKGWETEKGTPGLSLLKKFPEYDLILTGDNHKPFVVEHQGRLLVNPGSMMRTAADQIDHTPRVYLWYAQEKRVEPVYLPIEEGVLSREHLEKKKEKDDRMDAFVASLKNTGERKKSFEGNMKAHLKENPASKLVEERIWEYCK